MRMRARKRERPDRIPEYISIANGMSVQDYSILSITDAEGKILYVNDLYCSVTGFGRDELIGQTHRLVRSGVHSDSFYQNLWSVIRHDGVWRGMLQNRSKSGADFWVHTIIVPIKDKHRQEKQYLCMQHDVTPEIEMEYRKLAAARQQDMEKLLGSVIHEIGNPLTTVKGFLQQYNSSVMFRENEVGLLLDELGQIEETLHGLYKLAKIYQTRDFKSVHIKRLTLDVMENVKQETAAPDVRFSFRCTDEEFQVWGVPAQIKLLVQALLEDAVRAVLGSGTIDVNLYILEERRVCLRIACQRAENRGKTPEECIREDAFFDTGMNWSRMIQNQIMEHHQAEIRRSHMDGCVTEVRFPRITV